MTGKMAEKSAEIECMTWRTVALILAAVGVAEALVVSGVTPTLVAGRHTRCVMNDGGGAANSSGGASSRAAPSGRAACPRSRTLVRL